MYCIENCTCQRPHSAPIEKIITEGGAINMLPEVLKAYKDIYIVADSNTYRVAGEKARDLLIASGHKVELCILPEPVLPNEKAIGTVLLRSPRMCDYILAVGSGTINDTCRVVSYRLGLSYGVLGTAPSMDGYTSALSPIIVGNYKETIYATTPKHIFADIDIMQQAPYDMLLAGIGDMAGKYIAILDWQLANMKTGEYYCPTIANEVLNAADACLATAQTIANRDYNTIKALAEGLIISGLGMAYSGVSRPASGAEHMIAHTWECQSLELGEMPKLHGLEVAQAALVCTDFYIRLYNQTKDEAIKALIQPFVKRLNGLHVIYEKAGIKPVTTDEKRINEGIINGRFFRKRYTILEYLFENGLLEDYINDR